MHEVTQFCFPTTVHFGVKSSLLLPDSLKILCVSRPLLVTDRGLRDLPIVHQTAALLRQAGLQVEIFSQLGGNPVVSQVVLGAHVYGETHRDAVVALGGGAALDVGKAIALLATGGGDLLDYAEKRRIGEPLPPVVAIPTTAGTGSEVGRSFVVSDDETHRKHVIFDERLMPREVFCDPELLVGLPASLTAATGMDAVTHLVEAYLARGTHPMCDGIALEGLRLAQQSLVACVQMARQHVGPTDAHLHVRGLMAHAALMGGVAFQKGLGVTHSCAHALSTVCDLHHGLANALMLRHTLAFNMSACPERFASLARVLQIENGAALPHWAQHLNESLGLPSHLGEVGVTAAHLPRLVQVGMADRCRLANPRAVTSEAMAALFAAALEP